MVEHLLRRCGLYPFRTYEATEALVARRTTPDAGKISSGGALIMIKGMGIAALCARNRAGELDMPRKLVTTSWTSNRLPPSSCAASIVTLPAPLDNCESMAEMES